MTPVFRAAATSGVTAAGIGASVSHVNDAKRRAKYHQLLGEPPALADAAQVGGRRQLDTVSAGQQEFQALLLWCLLSPGRSLRWDTLGGRSFQDMQYYLSWVSSQGEHLAIGWTIPVLVASYLLPDLKLAMDIEPGGPRFSGIPGLRVEGFTKQAICLRHLPTGGALYLYDTCPVSQSRALRARRLDMEIRIRHAGKAKDPAYRPLWKSENLTSEEAEGLADWALGAHAPVLSAVMARIGLLFTMGSTDAELDTNPLTGRPRLSWWRGISLTQFETLLTQDDALKVNGAESMFAGHNSRFLSRGDAVMELRGPVDND